MVTIDLALRNLLAPTVVREVIGRLTDDRFYTGLDEADPILANRAALMQPQVVERLAKLLDIVGVRLGHVSMRQLVGFIAFLLSGGQRAAERLKSGQDATGLSYSNLAFEGGIGVLFETVRQVFDPATLTHPTWDERLWRGKIDPTEWLFAAPASALTLPFDQEQGFRVAKRRFFFEHSAGNELFSLVPHDEIEFERLLDRGDAGEAGLVRSLVLALNRFYEPDFPDRQRDRLLLWQSHRYDVRAPAAFVSLRDLSHQQLRIEVQRYADWVEKWLPPKQQARRSFAMVAKVGDRDVALLEVDRELYLTLLEGQRGLGRSSWSRTTTSANRPVRRPDRPRHGIRERGWRRERQDPQCCHGSRRAVLRSAATRQVSGMSLADPPPNAAGRLRSRIRISATQLLDQARARRERVGASVDWSELHHRRIGAYAPSLCRQAEPRR